MKMFCLLDSNGCPAAPLVAAGQLANRGHRRSYRNSVGLSLVGQGGCIDVGVRIPRPKASSEQVARCLSRFLKAHHPFQNRIAGPR